MEKFIPLRKAKEFYGLSEKTLQNMLKMDNLKRLEPHQGDGYLMSVEPKDNQPQSVIAEFHHVNKKMILQDKSFLCDQIFLNNKSLKISEVDLTSKDRDL